MALELDRIAEVCEKFSIKTKQLFCKIKKLLDSHEWLIYAVLFCIFLAIHLLITETAETGGDDQYFGAISVSDLLSFTAERYNGWSSRSIIEAVLVSLLHLPRLIWCVVDSVMLTSVAWVISYLFTKNNLACKIISSIVIMIFPFTIMGSAGWYATTLNYLWPLACLLISFIPIKHALSGYKEHFWMYPIYSISLLFACNQEQACLLCLGFYVIFSVYCAMKKKSAKFIYFQTLLALASVFFILACPGNGARLASEITSWYPSFGEFNLIQKAMLGVNSTFAMLIVRCNLPYIVLSVLLVMCLKKSPFYVRVISTIPLMSILSYHLFSDFLQNIFPFLEKVFSTILNFSHMPGAKIQPQSPLIALSLRDETNWILVLLAMGTIISVCFCVYCILKKEKYAKHLVPLVIVSGVLSAFMMGFSPTVYASHNRTFTFLDCSMIIAILVICCKAEKSARQKMILLIVIAAILQLCNTIYVIA